ncbi:aminotransferase class I/II-fold pyridoxal phosphate-dependent enzyme, partial [Oleiagrimonas sp.]|uniref:aminotransferase class I/II-fold pyridoxal phosphate-dependent enzyme n=1 Tax=Oleiagrimonas sp. TaxID=2010330 RepID=UPI00261A6A43
MSRPDLRASLQGSVNERIAHGLLRRARTVEAMRSDGHCIVDGRNLTAFCSNDYLGLATHPEMIKAMQHAAGRYGVGSTAAHLVCGHHREHALLESALAEWTGRERALLFSTGIMANLGVMQALLGRPGMRRTGLCVQDKLNHASLIDGARATPATVRRYRHVDVDAAARQLAAAPHSAALLATDGVFSMDGDIAPLADLAALCARQQATLMVDDAHGLGVLGPQGAGSIAAAGLSQSQVPVL